MNDIYNLPEDKFPFTIRFLNAEGTEVHTIEVPEPGGLEVPPLARDHGPISVQLDFADGTSRIQHPESG